MLRRHAPALQDLTGDEWAELATVLAAVCEAQRRVAGADKEYVMQFAEADGHRHVHFHVVPRLAQRPDDLRGPRVMDGLGAAVPGRPPSRRWATLAALRDELVQRPGRS